MDNDRRAVYEYLMNSGSQIKMSTYAIFDGVVNHDYVVVHSAPPRVVRELVGFCKMVSMSEQGLLIPVTKKETSK
ncbi:hypothetical protein SEA_LIZZ_87 [Streptomyces phage Lizz]|jgi:hypothetical protein|nr:hypothetical protein SEA_PHTOWN_87 [Streptomyces phage PHTowN]QNO12904.1 hypothetical protein SEA_SHAKENBAKE_87 [Streptomyces phage ShakeNBake]QYW07634.1 hypothetical protein SEA_LIZZ_87 [Streptomyces phage Lizz]